MAASNPMNVNTVRYRPMPELLIKYFYSTSDLFFFSNSYQYLSLVCWSSSSFFFPSWDVVVVWVGSPRQPGYDGQLISSSKG